MAVLYVVATPIGNLQDISFRALDTLKKVKYIACEDTRQTRKLLNFYGIEDKHLISYHEHNEEEASEKILKILEKEDVALVSDAGTPCISDPGYRVVKKARENNIKVVPIPGPFAGAAALSASGLPSDKFLFLGFLPQKRSHKEKVLKKYIELDATLILYESPNRVMDTVDLIKDLDEKANIVVAKELTKIHEEFIIGNPFEILDFFEKNPDKIKGEFVILVHPSEKEATIDEDEIKRRIIELKNQNLKSKEIAKIIADEYNLPKNQAYKMALENGNEG
jgi:conserved hypothetical protein TIGR00096